MRRSPSHKPLFTVQSSPPSDLNSSGEQSQQLQGQSIQSMHEKKEEELLKSNTELRLKNAELVDMQQLNSLREQKHQEKQRELIKKISHLHVLSLKQAETINKLTHSPTQITKSTLSYLLQSLKQCSSAELYGREHARIMQLINGAEGVEGGEGGEGGEDRKKEMVGYKEKINRLREMCDTLKHKIELQEKEYQQKLKTVVKQKNEIIQSLKRKLKQSEMKCEMKQCETSKDSLFHDLRESKALKKKTYIGGDYESLQLTQLDDAIQELQQKIRDQFQDQ